MITPSLAGKITATLASLAALAVIAAACTSGGGSKPAGESGVALQVGDVAPDFTPTATDGTTISLSDYAGSKSVLLYFSMGYG